LEGLALPEGAVFREGASHFAFELAKSGEEGNGWIFIPREVKVNARQNGWLGITFLEDVPESALFAQNNAYYIHAEMKKGEVDVDH
jgi:membrane fusion protein, heavy metal efflux system